MKTIRCNLIKHVGYLQLSQNYYIRIWAGLPRSGKKSLENEIFSRSGKRQGILI